MVTMVLLMVRVLVVTDVCLSEAVGCGRVQ